MLGYCLLVTPTWWAAGVRSCRSCAAGSWSRSASTRGTARRPRPPACGPQTGPPCTCTIKLCFTTSKTHVQGCGSALIFWRIRIQLFFSICKMYKDPDVGTGSSLTKLRCDFKLFFYKWQLLTISIHFSRFLSSNFLYWIRIRIPNADPDAGRKFNADQQQCSCRKGTSRSLNFASKIIPPPLAILL